MINHNIRKAIKEDVSDILRLLIELAVFENEPDSVKITEEELIKDGFGDKPRYECFLAEAENEIVGLAFFTERYSTWGGDTLHLEELIVTQKYRGKGVGLSLYKAFLNEAKTRGANRVEWSVLDWNKSAIDLYKKSGAQIESLNSWKIVRMDKESINNFLDS